MAGSSSRWENLSGNENKYWWKRFNEKFKFKPGGPLDPYPGIVEPTPSTTFDLDVNKTVDQFWESYHRLNSEALSAFNSFSTDARMIVLDWQHQGYRFHPSRAVIGAEKEWEVPVYPNGDYYSFLLEDLSAGTFGHPWHRTICVFGEALMPTLGNSLQDWLPPIRINGKSAI